MRIQITARTASEGQDRHLSWDVEVTVDGQPSETYINLRDPLDRKSRKLCRWYLDRYRQREPYSTTRAKEAVLCFNEYGTALQARLGLSSLLSGNYEVLIEIEDHSGTDNDSKNSIHQLYWEFLEDENLWDSTLTVTVRRRVYQRTSNSLLQSLTNTTTTTTTSHDFSKSIRILLITARDVQREYTNDSDISPTLVYNVLDDLKSKLRTRHGRRFKFVIEILRPATFEALESLLDQKRSTTHHHYDIVHFDMHGSVQADELGVFKGYLHFNDPESWETTMIPGDRIADVFKGLHIPFAVLNACDSAVATGGKGGNIAQIIALRAFDQVLAMCHPASESATSMFLAQFYHQFLSQLSSFTTAARVARRYLRNDPLRSARFHLQIPVVDYQIPVVYSSSTDPVRDWSDDSQPREPSIAESASDAAIQQDSSLHALNTIELVPVQPGAAQVFKPTKPAVKLLQLFGREFDMMRFEKMLMSKGHVYMHGSMGVGKTTFLANLAVSWAKTAFISKVFFIDVAKAQEMSNPSLARILAKQAKLQDPSCPLDANAFTYDEECMAHLEPFFAYIENLRAAFFFDDFGDVGLDQTCINLAFSELLNSFLDRLLSMNKTRSWEQQKLVITTGRSPEAPRSVKTKFPTYELMGLEKSDAISLVSSLRPDSLQNETDMSHTWEAESVVDLLKGNPGGLMYFVKLAYLNKMSLTRLYTILHSEDIVRSLPTRKIHRLLPMFPKFIIALTRLSDESYAICAMLAWYWHDGPIVNQFATMLVKQGIVDNANCVHRAVEEIAGLGWVKTDQDQHIYWIDPLFTILTRIHCCSALSRFINAPDDPWLQYRRRFSFDGLQLVIPQDGFPWSGDDAPRAGPAYAVRLLSTVLSSHIARDTDERYWSYLLLFLRSSEERCTTVLDRLVLSETMGELEAASTVFKENFLFVVKLCNGRGLVPIPPQAWPMTLLTFCGYLIASLYNVKQAEGLAKEFETLLQGAISHGRISSGKQAIKTGDLYAPLRISSALAELHRRHIPNGTQKMTEYIDLAFALLQDSDTEYSNADDPSLALSKALLLFEASCCYIEKDEFHLSKQSIEKGSQLLRNVFNHTNRAVGEKRDAFLKDKDPKEAALWTAYLESYLEPNAPLKIEEVSNLALAEAMGYDMGDYASKQRTGITAAGHPFNRMFDMMIRNAAQLTSRSQRSHAHENDIERGHWRRQMAHHSGLTMRSFGDLDFDQVEQHLQAQEKIAKDHGLEGDDIVKLQDARDAMIMLRKTSIMSGTAVLETDNLTYMKDFFDEKAHRLGDRGPPLNELIELLIASKARDSDEDLPHNQAPSVFRQTGSMKELLIKFTKKHLSQVSRNPEYGMSLICANLDSLKVIRKLEDAEDANKELEIYEHLNELRRLADLRFFDDILSVTGIDFRRDFNTRRFLQDLAEQMKTNSDTQKMNLELCETYLCSVNKAQYILELDGSKGKYDEISSELFRVHDSFAFTAATLKANSALRDEKDKTKFLGLARDIIVAYKAGSLDKRMEDEADKLVFLEIWSSYYQHTVIQAVDGHQWADAHQAFSEWRSNKEVWELDDFEPIRRQMQKLAKMCERSALFVDFWDTIQTLDGSRIQTTWEQIEKLAAKGTSKWIDYERSMLSLCSRTQFQARVQLSMFGPEAAKEYVSAIFEIVKSQGVLYDTPK